MSQLMQIWIRQILMDTDEDDNSSVESGMSSDSNSLLPMLELESVASDTSIDIGKTQIMYKLYE